MLVSGISRGGAWAHPLFLNQAEAKAPRNFFSETEHSHYLRVWMTGPPLISMSGSATSWSLLGLKKG